MEENKENNTTDIIQEAEQRAKNYFRQGLNCSECVLQTILDLNETGLPPEIIRLASGFGNGMGNTKNTCGAITGAMLALSSVKGRKTPFEKETPKERIQELREMYPPFTEMIREIEDTYGTLICKELSDPHGDFNGKERKKSCQEIIGYCAALAQKYINESK